MRVRILCWVCVGVAVRLGVWISDLWLGWIAGLGLRV